jgi:hypothetical protein
MNSVVIPNCIKPNCLRGGGRDALPWVAPEYAQLTGRSWQHDIEVDVKGLGLKSRTWETMRFTWRVCA